MNINQLHLGHKLYLYKSGILIIDVVAGSFIVCRWKPPAAVTVRFQDFKVAFTQEFKEKYDKTFLAILLYNGSTFMRGQGLTRASQV